jgi:hypothetical protein
MPAPSSGVAFWIFRASFFNASTLLSSRSRPRGGEAVPACMVGRAKLKSTSQVLLPLACLFANRVATSRTCALASRHKCDLRAGSRAALALLFMYIRWLTSFFTLPASLVAHCNCSADDSLAPKRLPPRRVFN